MRIFPDLGHASWGYLNLNQVARAWLRDHNIGPDVPNPLLDPVCCAAMVRAAHIARHLDCSYGGWLEDRRDLWRGSYLDVQGTYQHLGVDFNVPVGTRVAASHAAHVILVDSDVPEEGGWGTRIILLPHDRRVPRLIYAHLDPKTSLRTGDRVMPGDELARVGESPENGGWFPHLHVQCIAGDPNLLTLDGYGHERDVARWSGICPDPLPYLT